MAGLTAQDREIETLLERVSDEFFSVDSEWRYTYVNERAVAQARRVAGRDLTAEDLLGRICWELFPQFVGTPFHLEFHRALREQTVVEFEAQSAPTGRWVEVRAYPSNGGLSVFSRDVSARKGAEADLERGAHQQAIVAELGQRALTSEQLQPLLDEAVGLAARALGVELAGVAEIVPGADGLRLRAGVGWRKGVLGDSTGPARADTLVGHTILADGPVVSEDVLADARFNVSPLLSAERPMSAVTVVIGGRDKPFGVLGAFSRERRSFSADDVNFMRAVANVLATAVDHSHTGERPTEAQVRVLLVEDHAAVRQAIASAFEREAGFEVVGEAASLAEARDMLGNVDVAVLDLGLPDGNGADLITELRKVNRRAQALVLSATLDRAEIARAVQSGAAGVLDKTADLDEVVNSVRRLRAGETLLPPDEVLDLLRYAGRQREREHDDRAAIAQLTPRELEVLQAIADGLDGQRMAQRLHISVRTARNHINNILTKLGVHSQLQALVLALRYDVVEIRVG